MSRSKGLLKNMFSSALPQIVNIIINLILPALIIGLYGSKINGLISTSKSIISYVSLVGAGIATAVTQQLYSPVAKNDDETVKGMLNSASRMFFKYGVIFCLILFVVAIFYPFTLKEGIDYFTVFSLLLVMGLSGASEFFVVGRCRSILYANQKVYVCTLIQALSLVIGLILAVIMIKLEASIVLVQLGISLIYVSRAVFLQVYVNKKYPNYRDYKSCPPIDRAVSKRKDAMIHQLTGLAVMSSQSLILTAFVGLEAASIYAVYSIVFQGLSSICMNLNTAISPFLGRGIAVDSKEKITTKYDLTELFFTVLATFVFSVTAIMLTPFITLYTRGSDIPYVSTSFGILFVIAYTFHVARLPSSALINVAGHFKETKWRALIEAGICVVVSIVTTIFIGKNGVLIGTGCALAWRGIDMIIYANNKILNRKPIKSAFRLIRCLIIVLISCFVSTIINFNIESYLQWVVYAIIVSVVVLIVVSIETVVFEFKILKSIKKKL